MYAEKISTLGCRIRSQQTGVMHSALPSQLLPNSPGHACRRQALCALASAAIGAVPRSAAPYADCIEAVSQVLQLAPGCCPARARSCNKRAAAERNGARPSGEGHGRRQCSVGGLSWPKCKATLGTWMKSQPAPILSRVHAVCWASAPRSNTGCCVQRSRRRYAAAVNHACPKRTPCTTLIDVHLASLALETACWGGARARLQQSCCGSTVPRPHLRYDSSKSNVC
jgi:hypothetical protein